MSKKRKTLNVENYLTNVKDETLIYIDDLEKCDKFSKKENPTWKDWLDLHLVSTEFKYLVSSEIYKLIMELKVVDCWSDCIDGIESLVLVVKVNDRQRKQILKEPLISKVISKGVNL